MVLYKPKVFMSLKVYWSHKPSITTLLFIRFHSVSSIPLWLWTTPNIISNINSHAKKEDNTLHLKWTTLETIDKRYQNNVHIRTLDIATESSDSSDFVSQLNLEIYSSWSAISSMESEFYFYSISICITFPGVKDLYSNWVKVFLLGTGKIPVSITLLL